MPSAKLVDEIGQARRIIVLAEAPAQPAAYNLVYFLEQGGFQIYIARPGVVDLARTIHTAQPNDLLLAMDVSGQSPNIARTLNEAQARGIRTATIAGAASLPSTRAADVVISALERPSTQTGAVIVNVIIYILVEALRWAYRRALCRCRAGHRRAIDPNPGSTTTDHSQGYPMRFIRYQTRTEPARYRLVVRR